MATTLMPDTETDSQNMEHALWRVKIAHGLLVSHRVLKQEDSAWVREEDDLMTQFLLAQQKVALLKAISDAG